MEPRFGQDFGHVRIHTGEQSASLNEQLNANAFTVGNHIFFGAGQFRPQESSGRQLIAHELTHTVQQASHIHREEKKSWWESVVDFSESFGWNMVDTFAPGLAPILKKGLSGAWDWMKEQASAAFHAVVDTLMAPVRTLSGVGQQLSALFAPMLVTIQAAAGQIARNDCTPLREAAEKIEKTAVQIITPIMEKVQPVVAAVKGFLSDVWDKIGAPILNWIEKYASQQWQQIKWLGQKIADIASWVWGKTEALRSVAAKAWSWLKNKLGIGEGPEGQDGLLQWVTGRFEAVWKSIQDTLAPFKQELKVILGTAAAVLLAVSPAGPIMAVGAAVAGAVQGLRWIAANWGKGNAIVQARQYLEKTLIPPLVGAIGRLQQAVSRVAATITSALASIAAALGRAAAAVGGTLLGFAVTAIQWLVDQANALAGWANRELALVAQWVATSIQRLQAFLHNMLQFLSRVGAVVLDVMGLPILLGEKIWNWVPACIRDPIVDFIGPIILQQIELFRELAKDNGAWQKTKADIAKLIKLVFKDHDLVGAMKSAFMLVLRVFNIPLDLLATLISKAMGAWDIVSRKPIDFIKNTVRSLAHGFKLLWNRIGFHLEYGLKGWLLGSLQEAKITPPADWTNPKDLFFFVLEVLGLSMDHLFELLAKRFNDQSVAKLRSWYGKISRAVDWINKTVDVNKSPAENTKGLIEKAKDFGTTILQGLVTWVTVKVGEELALMAASAAASAGLSEVLDIARRIYKALVTAQRWARRILDMANQALDLVLDIANGAIEKVGGQFEEILHRGMPVVIGFLADQVGLGGVGTEIANLVKKLREKVDAGILWLIDKVKAALDAIIGGIKAGVAAVLDWWNEKREFPGADGKTHTLSFDAGKRLIVRSDPVELETFLNDLIDGKNPKNSEATRKTAHEALVLYRATIKPVQENQQNLSKEATGIQEFGNNLTKLSKLLRSLVGGPQPEVKWNYKKGDGVVAVDQLSKESRKEGTKPSGTSIAWNLLRAARLTTRGERWVRMHLITAGVGGEGAPINWVPAPNKVNTGSEVRGFELRVESLVNQKAGVKGNEANCIWIEVAVKDFHPANPDKGFNAKIFASSVSMEAGLNWVDASGTWARSAPQVSAPITVTPPPDIKGNMPDLGTAPAYVIEAATHVPRNFADHMVKVRANTPFADVADFEIRMRAKPIAASGPSLADYDSNIKAVRSTVREGGNASMGTDMPPPDPGD